MGCFRGFDGLFWVIDGLFLEDLVVYFSYGVGFLFGCYGV